MRWCALVSLVVALSCAGNRTSSPEGTLRGQVKDPAGRPALGASVFAGDRATTTDLSGQYQLRAPAGTLRVRIELEWFESFEQDVPLAPGQERILDVELLPSPLRLLEADRALCQAYDRTFDWTRDKVSVAVISVPTQNALDRAFYTRNPALYRDTATEPHIAPSSPPSLLAGPIGFSYPLSGDPSRRGIEALARDSVVDRLEDTPLTEEELAAGFLWEPAVERFLTRWDLERSAGLYEATLAVRQQSWGGASRLPTQALAEGYLHAGTEVWVKLVFEGFLEVGADLDDQDGDGKKEIYARVNGALITPEIYQALSSYATARRDPLEMKQLLMQLLDDLYSRTNPVLVSSIGTPYEIPGLGTIEYPFAVIAHQGAGSVVNVLLMAP